jgi:cold shock protein
MAGEGTVRQWDDDEGWGVIDSTGTPGGCWVHFSAIVSDGYRRLSPGDRVTFTLEPAQQDGFAYRALQVWPPGSPRPARQDDGPSATYQSTLTIRWSDGTTTTGDFGG